MIYKNEKMSIKKCFHNLKIISCIMHNIARYKRKIKKFTRHLPNAYVILLTKLRLLYAYFSTLFGKKKQNWVLLFDFYLHIQSKILFDLAIFFIEQIPLLREIERNVIQIWVHHEQLSRCKQASYKQGINFAEKQQREKKAL